jgi:squalene-hopene/tetraprenyl-beta-curcumene cyclase
MRLASVPAGVPVHRANLSATMYGLAALMSAKIPTTAPEYRKALGFVERCQNYADDPGLPQRDPRLDDGGFFFSPADPIQNKAGGEDGLGRRRFRSYGSMTVDGLRCLLAAGLPADHPRVVAARNWLVDHFTVEHNPGSFDSPALQDAFYYYYCWGFAHAFLHLDVRWLKTPGGGCQAAPVDWPTVLAEAMLRRQGSDGTWANEFGEAKENDPLVATPMAAATLLICRQMLARLPEAAHPPAPPACTPRR